MKIRLYEFRDLVADFTHTRPHVVKGDLGQIERLIPVQEFAELFGGYVVWDPPDGSGIEGASIGVWGIRNVSRLRRILRERGAELERIKGAGPEQRIRRIARIRG